MWAPRRSAVLIKYSNGSDLLRKIFRGGACQVVDVDQHVWSIKALLLTMLHFRGGLKLSAQYFGHYANLTGCHLVVTFRNNGVNLGDFKLQNRSVKTASFQNGTYSDEVDQLRGARSGPDVAFGFSVNGIKWLYPGMDPQPIAHATGSLRSNLIPRRPHNAQRGPLLFISQWRKNMDHRYYEVEALVLPFLSTWCASREIDLVILGASRGESKREEGFFEALIGSGAFHFDPKAQDDWTEAYRQVDSAEIVVAVDSTLGVEAVLRGKKTCFFTDLSIHTVETRVFSQSAVEYGRGPFWVNNGSIEDFNHVLSKILSISEASYASEIGDTDWLGTSDPGMFQTRKHLIEVCPELEQIIQPLSRPVTA